MFKLGMVTQTCDPSTRDDEAGELFEDSLDYTVRPCLKNQTKPNQT